MKYLILLTLTAVMLFSCTEQSEPKGSYESEETDENPIIGRWKLQSHKKKETVDSEIDLKGQPTEVILSIMEGGYFVIYDTFTDPRFNQKGFNRISERSKGQWEFIDNKRLILHHNYDDSTRTEEMNVTMLNKNTLVTKGENRKSNIYKTYEGY
jgi:hypothetical protein